MTLCRRGPTVIPRSPSGREEGGGPSSWVGRPALREHVRVTTIEIPEHGRELAGDAGARLEPRARRRDEFEMLGLLLGILGIVFVLALTLGSAPLI
jgi:hypothetical protein